MKFIDVSDVPRRVRSKWEPVLEALLDGKVVVFEERDVARYSSETSLRGNILTAAKSKGLRVSVRKDRKTGDLYVFPMGALELEEAGPEAGA